MAKGYWIGRIDVTDPDRYAEYAAANGAAYAAYGGRLLVRAGDFKAVEGAARSRNVVIEFPSYDQALACYRSDLYQAARALREDAASIELIVIEGYDGPQPGR
ncbi:DUF1330 domain-containing protein [Allobranchiibius sp. GilTou73]|uniref:DUF1330 domain-containing protein n=1 Tax=Allobranchiibius sp. GilTou73 TaxID=2904523 RepID=UPI001F491998|nr:DUF1330 domain-containing protein [Allobranchiibius sp. GilTou73]UIJ36509.1 DUF1330 domain-containing protein [Allobranchiibius sp. GilTou73]